MTWPMQGEASYLSGGHGRSHQFRNEHSKHGDHALLAKKGIRRNEMIILDNDDLDLMEMRLSSSPLRREPIGQCSSIMRQLSHFADG